MMVKRKMNILLIAVFIFSLFAGGFQAPVAAEGPVKTATVTVIGDAEKGTMVNEIQIPITDNATALDILSEAVSGDLETSETEWGLSLDKIKDLAVKDTNYWAFYVNGFFSSIGAGSYLAQNGDHYTFSYEDYMKSKDGVSIKVIGKNNEVISESLSPFSIIGQPTALQLLQTQVGSDKVGLLETEWGLMIDSINGLAAEGNSYWSFLVNGEGADVGAGSYVLQPGDEITFKYETYVPPVENPTDEEGIPSDEDTVSPSKPIDSAVIQSAIDSAITHIPLTDWGVVALKRAGKTIPADYLDRVTKEIQDENGAFRNITEYERYTLGILSAGGDPTNVGGYNLISSIYNGNVTRQGMNGVAYALIALDSENFEIPANATWTREKLVNYLLDNQNPDGSWPGADSISINDYTAIVLISLAPYKEQANVGEAVDSAVNYLSGQYNAGKIDNSMTAAQTIIALSSLKIDPNGALFTNNEGTGIISFLLSFQRQDQSFSWMKDGDLNLSATVQAVHALEAYQLYINGKGLLFDFTSFEKQPVVQKVDSASVNAAATQNGKPLPNTATNSYNLIILGLFVILAGITVFIFGKRKNA